MKPYYEHAGITIYHGDSKEILPVVDACDLLLTDPPYALGVDRRKGSWGGGTGNSTLPRSGQRCWDDAPVTPEHLDLARYRATHQIIFGGNFFSLPVSRCWLVWDKQNGTNDFADCELAWTNLDMAAKLIRHEWNGMLRANKEVRFDHPTQKPVALMAWCIQQVEAKERNQPASSVLDPFMGSGTTLRAAKDLGRKAIGIEIEECYCEIAAKRMSQEVLAF